MEQRFDVEYRKLIEEDMPDLWGRIEAGIEAESVPKKHAFSANKLLRYSKYILPAAAVLLLTLLLFWITLYGGRSESAAAGAVTNSFVEATTEDIAVTDSLIEATAGDMAATDSLIEAATEDIAETSDLAANGMFASERFEAEEESSAADMDKAGSSYTASSNAEQYAEDVVYQGSAPVSKDQLTQGTAYVQKFFFTSKNSESELTVLVSKELFNQLRTDKNLPKQGEVYDLTLRLADAVWLNMDAEYELYELVYLVRK